MPIGFPIVPGWYLLPAVKLCPPMLPGGMVPIGGVPLGFYMVVAGWVAFTGKLPA